MYLQDYLALEHISKMSLSILSGVPQSVITDLCTGKLLLSDADDQTIQALSAALNCSTKAIHTFDDPVYKDGKLLSCRLFMTAQSYYTFALSEMDAVLSHESALEYRGMVSGNYSNDIHVYAKKMMKRPYRSTTVHSFDQIDYETMDGIRITTINQTFNDLLASDQTDLQQLDEALNYYYSTHHDSFDGLKISQENLARFEQEKEYAIAYYND